jgi:electron transport complex protein RnfB
MDISALADAIDRTLPQTQCTRCGYPACRPYAEAVAAGEAAINRCPPGGEAGIRTLSALTGRAVLPLDPACGAERPRHVARIDEPRCIGCTLCILACPVDAIVGAPRRLHAVLADLCTGCDLCIAPCPVDCIDMAPATGDDASWDATRAEAARSRYHARRERLARETAERAAKLGRRSPQPGVGSKRAAIDAALARARARRAAFAPKRGAGGR